MKEINQIENNDVFPNPSAALSIKIKPMQVPTSRLQTYLLGLYVLLYHRYYILQMIPSLVSRIKLTILRISGELGTCWSTCIHASKIDV